MTPVYQILTTSTQQSNAQKDYYVAQGISNKQNSLSCQCRHYMNIQIYSFNVTQANHKYSVSYLSPTLKDEWVLFSEYVYNV